MTGGMAFWRAVGEALMDGRDVVELDVVADALRMGGPHPMADALRAAAPDLIAQDWADFLEAVARVGDCNVNLLRHHGRAELDALLRLVAEALARPRRDAAATKKGASHARADLGAGDGWWDRVETDCRPPEHPIRGPNGEQITY